ncbi:MAG: replication restart helicase PriA [Chloroflexota bacterium]
MSELFAELVINIEAPLENTFHYHVPSDLQNRLKPGHFVEVEFGRRLAQGIVVALRSAAPVPETKPVISLIDPNPVVYPWQIKLAAWLSDRYLAPMNACLRLMLPPGLTRWAEVTVDLNSRWDGSGRLTPVQEEIIELLREHGDLRGKQLKRRLPKEMRDDWQRAVNQLAQRDILLKGSVLEPPRARPRKIRTAELIAGPRQLWNRVMELGRASLQSDVLYYLAQSADPLPAEDAVREATGAGDDHIEGLIDEGLIQRTSQTRVIVPVAVADDVPENLQDVYRELPAAADTLDDAAVADLEAQGLAEELTEAPSLNLTLTRQEALEHIFRLRNGEKYWAVINYLARAAQPAPVGDVYEATGSTIYHLRRLKEQDLIRLGSEEVWRDPLADRDFIPSEAPRLTTDQARVWQTIKQSMASDSDEPSRPFLLHGVTGSGKTEIYMRAINHALQHDRQAIVLVPEIALTPQTVRRFAARFPGRVAVLHSRLSSGERYDTWRRARQGLFDIVVGPRSALFTPFPNLGVIVVDEEHDHSYKQGAPVPPPYYHARTTAVELGRIVGATVIMGSATPDLVTYHQARAERYCLLELPRRVMGHRSRIESQAERLQIQSRYAHDEHDPEETVSIPLPPVQVVDLRQELRAGNRSVFSRALQSAVDETLERGEQAILFLNRRGSATFVLCRDCGHVLKCPRCEVPLTFHRSGAALVCHHCGRSERQPDNCPKCGSGRIKYFGLGTEQLERLVQQRWPDARTVRWDSDTTGGKGAHEQILASFVNQKADILVGTQMIAKGLDLPLVTLVGVISADVSLGLPDFGTGERTFQILTQVAGRAGRGLLGGRVIVQTYKPEHYAIQAAAEHDYVSFYLEEIRFRTQHSYPPFRRLARLLLLDPVNDRGRRKAEELATSLRQHSRDMALSATEIIGPAPPFFNRIDGRYRWQILLRSPDPVRLLKDFSVPRPWLVDIDPVSTL